MIDVAHLVKTMETQDPGPIVAMPREIFDEIVRDLKAGQRCAAALTNARSIMTSALTATVA